MPNQTTNLCGGRAANPMYMLLNRPPMPSQQLNCGKTHKGKNTVMDNDCSTVSLFEPVGVKQQAKIKNEF